MGRFELRYTDEQVQAAREKIATGITLRAAAAEIGCAPSTLSVRLKKTEAAESGTGERAPLSEQELAAAGRPEYILALKRIAFAQETGTRDRLSAIKELLRLEPAGSKEVELGSVFHVYPDRIVHEPARDGSGTEPGEVPAQQ